MNPIASSSTHSARRFLRRACLASSTSGVSRSQRLTPGARWNGPLVGLGVVVGAALGCSRSLSDEEFAQRFEAYTARKGQVTAAPSVAAASTVPAAALPTPAPAKQGTGGKKKGDAPGGTLADSAYQTACLSDEAKTTASETARLLIALEAMMDGYSPVLPVAPDRPEKCLTAIAAQNDPMGARVEALLAADHAAAAAAADRKSREIKRRFQDVELPLAWSWVSAIVPGHEFEVAPGVLVKEPTELMKRLASSPGLKVDAPQHCIVAQAQRQGDQLLLTCRGPRQKESFYVEVDPQSGAAGGELATVGVGDLVTFSGQLVLTHRKRPGEHEERWAFKSVAADGASLAARSTCCHPDGK